MKKSVITLYSLFVILALLGLCGWLGYSYYTGTSQNHNSFEENLPALNGEISTLLRETEDPGSDHFNSAMEGFIDSHNEIKGLLIYSMDNRLFYTRLESNNKRLVENLKKNDSYLMEEIIADSYLPPFGIEHKAADLMTIKETDLKISYLHETFSPVKIYELLLNALYLIAGLFVLTLLLLVILTGREKRKSVEKNDDFFEPPTPDPSLAEDLSSSPTTEESFTNTDLEMDGPADLDLDNLDFDFPDEEAPSVPDLDSINLDSMDLDLPEADATDDDMNLDSMDFDLPEEESTDDEMNLDSMDFDLPEEESTDDDMNLDSMDFDLPEAEAIEDDMSLDSMDFDLPEEESTDDDMNLESMDFDLPEEESTDDDMNLESLDFDLPEADDSPEELDIEPLDLDMLEDEGEDEAELALDSLDLEIPSEDSLDDGGDLFDDEMPDLEDESDDLLGDLSDEEILADPLPELDDNDEIEDLPNLEDFMADENLLDEPEEEGDHQLYSPRSNVCWENFIDDRLPQELDRAASENEDLSFIYLRDNSVQNDEDYRAFSEVLTRDFPYRDLIFEWGDQGFAMILPNSDLVETLEKLDVFVNSQPESDIRIGATSRNGRLLDKDQLIGEASSAIKRTSADNKIVGFRADPERYRDALNQE
ncbi:MAG: hypothetical protein PQJ59_17555 [Spirochaetales bacterium]|nr:hypothetical protein [Spirochaetales bacterium]